LSTDTHHGPSTRAFRVSFALAAATALAVRVAAIANAYSVASLSDDAFIALDVARTLGRTGRLATSGIQPLWILVTAPVYALLQPAGVEQLDRAARASMAIGATADLVTLCLLAWVLYRVAGPVPSGVGAWVWALHPGVLFMSTNALETSLATACLVAVVGVAELLVSSRRRDLLLGALIGLGMLARIDLGALGVAVVLVAAWDRRHDARGLSWLAGFVGKLAAGWAVIYLPWMAFMYAQTGDLVPVSGAATAYLGYDVAATSSDFFKVPYTLGLMRHATLQLAFAAPYVALTLLAALPFARRLASFRLVATHAAFVVVFYTFYVGAWWHFWRYFTPVLVLEVIVLALAVGRLTTLNRRVGFSAALACVALVVVSYRLAYPFDFAHSGYRQEAVTLRSIVPANATVGAWESGALAYYLEGVTVVNLDGVADAAAYQAIRKQKLDDYMLERGVTLFVAREFGAGLSIGHTHGRVRLDARPNPGLTFMKLYVVVEVPPRSPS
jgi:hypothetical protein